MEIISDGRILTHTSSIDKKIEWIKNWVLVGGHTPFNDICMLQGEASYQTNKAFHPPNVIWGNHKGKEVLTIDGLTVPLWGWGILYTELIRRIKANLKLVTFIKQTSLKILQTPPHSATLPQPSQWCSRSTGNDICCPMSWRQMSCELASSSQFQQQLTPHPAMEWGCCKEMDVSMQQTYTLFVHSWIPIQWAWEQRSRMGIIARDEWAKWQSLCLLDHQRPLFSDWIQQGKLNLIPTSYPCLISFARPGTYLIRSVMYHTFPPHHIPSSSQSTFYTVCLPIPWTPGLAFKWERSTSPSHVHPLELKLH